MEKAKVDLAIANVEIAKQEFGKSNSRSEISKSRSRYQTYAKLFTWPLKHDIFLVFLIQNQENGNSSSEPTLPSRWRVRETYKELFSIGWTSTSTLPNFTSTSAIFISTTAKVDLYFLVRNELLNE